ncbi:cardiolipin synthase [Ruegeria sp. 1NDH52C]|uniref:Cardiolipin synthase n=1 Tax=Ruegeria alba TaxID=2916756 RepID=A0ABS9P299_9RHOB|nr:cardiolipin synthase [Ruegeria alba]MCE8523584.1 cardiolipin synthase [Ruegeria pomeroyi]MCE8553419.1 cardiolipin synthase [Ruegeria pomeroyi]MCG6560622.1 cardiolipin synthase [Ruegeria alba]
MIWIALHYALVLACAARVLLRPHRDPSARVAWLAVLFALPVAGVVAYLLLGETSIGRKRVERLRQVLRELPKPPGPEPAQNGVLATPVPDRYAQLFNIGRSISGYDPVGGNRARLMKDSDAVIDEMIADIDGAQDHVHLMFYIWLPDGNGGKMVEALKRAAARGVTCRAMVDDLGSRDLIRSPHWEAMGYAGVKLARALKIGNPLWRVFDGRVDLRDHRKILVIDNRVTYCGSQNCADPAFLPKAKYAPWVDAVMRFEGPVVRQAQHLFVSDWMANFDEDISDVLDAPLGPKTPGFTAQVVATGPTVRNSAMPEMFESIMYTALRELVITTPYYVPTEAIQAALCAAANRGVDVTIVFPARNDDFAVGATSRSYYEDLLTAGVKIYEFQPGLLHTKSMTVDGELALIGSANMDRRSFDLNYENNILFHDATLTAELRARQKLYIAASMAVTLEQVQGWPWHERLWNNVLATVGPVL